jgi:hypothetical protein
LNGAKGPALRSPSINPIMQPLVDLIGEQIFINLLTIFHSNLTIINAWPLGSVSDLKFYIKGHDVKKSFKKQLLLGIKLTRDLHIFEYDVKLRTLVSC